MVSHLLLKTAKCACPATHISNLNPSAGIIPSQHTDFVMLPILYLSQTLSSFITRGRRGYRLIVSVLLVSGLASCGNLDQYDITLNDRTLYTSRNLFEDYYLPDVALSNCVTQAIEDGQVFTVSGLEVLNCSEAGIESLSGLSRFSGLKRLKLTDNNIRNLVELSKLTQLEELRIEGNNVVDIVPLTALPSLNLVSIDDNPALQCHSLVRFRGEVRVIAPEHCSS